MAYSIRNGLVGCLERFRSPRGPTTAQAKNVRQYTPSHTAMYWGPDKSFRYSVKGKLPPFVCEGRQPKWLLDETTDIRIVMKPTKTSHSVKIVIEANCLPEYLVDLGIISEEDNRRAVILSEADLLPSSEEFLERNSLIGDAALLSRNECLATNWR